MIIATKTGIIVLRNITAKHVVKQFGNAITWSKRVVCRNNFQHPQYFSTCCMVSKHGLDTNNWLLGLEISIWWWGMGHEIRLKYWSYLWVFLVMNSLVIVLIGLSSNAVLGHGNLENWSWRLTHSIGRMHSHSNLVNTSLYWRPHIRQSNSTNCCPWHIQVIWETDILVWVPKLWHPKNTFQFFFFQLHFNKNM